MYFNNAEEKFNNLVKNYKRYNEKMTNNIKEVFNDVDNLLINKLLETPIIKNLMHNKLSYKNFNKIIEDAGKTFNLKESKIYNINFQLNTIHVASLLREHLYCWLYRS